jgi:hypothetical protein
MTKKRTESVFQMDAKKDPANSGRVFMMAEVPASRSRRCSLSIPDHIDALLDQHVSGFKTTAIVALAEYGLRALIEQGKTLTVTSKK